MISKTGVAFAVLYVAAAMYLIYDDRHAQGGWISFHGTISAIATLPAWGVCEMLGFKPDYTSNVQMGTLVAICAGAQKLFTKFFG